MLALVATDVFEILADPTRRRLLGAMRGGERAVNELVAEVGISQPGVSKQLALLHEAGFVEVRPEGRKRYYSLRPEPFRELEAWVREHQEAIEARFRRLDAYLDRMKKDVNR